MKPSKHQSSKQRGQDRGWKVHDRANLLFFTHTLCMNYVIAMFLMVSSMNTRNLLLYLPGFVPGQPPQKRTEIYNKDLCRVS